MSFGIKVQNGTGAGRKVQKTRGPWTCTCPNNLRQAHPSPLMAPAFKGHPGHVYSCPDCGTRRPEQ